MTDFSARLAARIQQHGPLCIGIDPSRDALTRCGLPDSAEGALAFGKLVLDAADYALPIVKPQMAFFERFGSAGMRAVEALAAHARQHDVLLLLDVKRGDIDSTARAYAEAYFSAASPLRVDAITVSPYLGIGALQPFFELAAANSCGVFVVVRSSNPEGSMLQRARQSDGSTVAQDLCRRITELNEPALGTGRVGAVVGATCDDAADTVAKLPRSYILAPGVGAQGASFTDVRDRMHGAHGRVLPNVLRAILANGGKRADIRAAIAALRDQARVLL